MGILLAVLLSASSPCADGKCSVPTATVQQDVGCQPIRSCLRKCKSRIKNRRKPVRSCIKFLRGRRC